MTMRPRTSSGPRHAHVLLRLLRAVVQPFRGSAPGATLTEYMLVTGFVALFGILAFNRFGRTLHKAYQEEARHVAGQGAPGASDLLGAIGGLTDPNGVCDLVTGVCIGGGCFSAGTPVSTEKGDRPIESIVPGDRVWARDPETGAVGLRTVSKTWIRKQAPVITLELGDGTLGVERLKVTEGHRFWVEGSGWVPAGELAATPLWSTNASVVATVLDAAPEITTVYNLEVEGFHTYFVGQSRALVHNQTALPGAPNNCPRPGNPGIVPPGGAGGAGSGTRPPITQADVDRCKDSMRAKHGPMSSHTQTTTRPADAADQICNGMLAECANAPNKEACAKKWECIDRYVAKYPTSDYFKSAELRAKVARQCSDPGAVTKSCYKGAAQPVAISPARQNEINQAAKDRQDAQARGDQPAMVKASERAGDAAAKAYAEQAYPGYNCTFAGGSRVFDGVCVGPGGDVVILEAKGGGSQLGDRWDVTGKKRVQQGSPEYVDSVVEDLRNSNDPAKKALAEDIQAAIEDRQLTYKQVTQQFDNLGNPKAPTVREFELNRARCPG